MHLPRNDCAVALTQIPVWHSIRVVLNGLCIVLETVHIFLSERTYETHCLDPVHPVVVPAFLRGGAGQRPPKACRDHPLPGLKDGDFDHFAADIDGHRLFLTAEENDKLEILDTKTKSTSPHNARDKAPHAILFRKDLKKLFVVEGDASAVKIYDSETYKRLAKRKFPSTLTRSPTMPQHQTCMS